MYMYIYNATTEAKLTRQNTLAWLDEIFLHLEEATIELWKIVMWLILDKKQLYICWSGGKTKPHIVSAVRSPQSR